MGKKKTKQYKTEKTPQGSGRNPFQLGQEKVQKSFTLGEEQEYMLALTLWQVGRQEHLKSHII